jgi:MoaA/NifB/PqqE/SkfB family radical SAM enzyme
MMKISGNKFLVNTQSFPLSNRIGSAVTTFLMNLYSTRLLNIRAKRGPLFVSWLCTFRCNARCKICATSQMNDTYPETVSLEEARRIAHEIGKAKTWVVGFTGGEVLLWPHLFEVVRILKEYRVTTYIVTNGWLLKKNAQTIVDAGIDTVVVSIDSIDPDTHDRMRSLPGLYSRLLEGIEELKRVRKDGRPIIKTSTILTQRSFPEIASIVDSLVKIADVTSLQPLNADYENHPNKFDPEEAGELIPQPDQEQAIRDQLRNLGKQYPAFNTSYFRNIPDFWFHPDRLARIKCWSPFLRLQIFPGGEVFHCTARAKWGAIGNLRNMSLMDVWNSPEMTQQRETIRLHKNDCICWSQDSSFNAFLDSIPLLRFLPVWHKK